MSILQKLVLKLEVLLRPLLPILIVKKHIRALLVLVRNSRRLRVPLKPQQILCVKPPAHLLQSLGRQKLSFRLLHVVEDEEESFRGEVLVEFDIVDGQRHLLGVVRGRGVRIARDVGAFWLAVGRMRLMRECTFH